jgi:hypothetical protein
VRVYSIILFINQSFSSISALFTLNFQSKLIQGIFL